MWANFYVEKRFIFKDVNMVLHFFTGRTVAHFRVYSQLAKYLQLPAQNFNRYFKKPNLSDAPLV